MAIRCRWSPVGTTKAAHHRPRPDYWTRQPDHRQYRDQDRDGIPDRVDRDRDGDGVPDRYDRRPGNPRQR